MPTVERAHRRAEGPRRAQGRKEANPHNDHRSGGVGAAAHVIFRRHVAIDEKAFRRRRQN